MHDHIKRKNVFNSQVGDSEDHHPPGYHPDEQPGIIVYLWSNIFHRRYRLSAIQMLTIRFKNKSLCVINQKNRENEKMFQNFIYHSTTTTGATSRRSRACYPTSNRQRLSLTKIAKKDSYYKKINENRPIDIQFIIGKVYYPLPRVRNHLNSSFKVDFSCLKQNTSFCFHLLSGIASNLSVR